MTHAHREQVEYIYRRHYLSVVAWLQRKFPGTPHANVQDAVADAFTEALARPSSFHDAWRAGGDPALIRLIRQAAWRHLRGYWRKKSTRHELLSRTQEFDEPSHCLTPLVEASSQQILAHTLRLVDAAAVRFGGKHSRKLRSALHTRLIGNSDTEAARACGVPREYVNRAKRWIRSQLRTS
ncbi:MAG: hypothetical protein MJE77_10855 [Proteobacteria bacterium]|nr:hypothetical protein [Pseudomonadota bacterium]